MRVLLLGAGGFIGRHILAELIAHGHDVVGVARNTAGLVEAFPASRFVAMDLAAATAEADWAPHVAGIDVIVNAAGLLRGGDMDAVHVDMPRALHAAARCAGTRRSVLISAISARADVRSDYARSKLAGEEVVRVSGVAWTILRPSLVYAGGSYGGTSLLRGMAGLPWMVPIPGRGDFLFAPIHVDDLTRTVCLVCEDDRFARIDLEPIGPETLNLKRLLASYRAWLGFGTARFLTVPMTIMRIFARIGDFAGSGPICTNSLVQLMAGNAGDSAAFVNAIGFAPRSLATALRERPAEVQDRWHARLFFLAPVITIALALLWFASGLIGMFSGVAQMDNLVRALGLPFAFGEPLRIAGCCLDLFVGAVVVVDEKARWSTPLQLVAVLGYTMVIGAAVPSLWLDPLGPLLKNLPIIALILVHGAIRDKR